MSARSPRNLRRSRAILSAALAAVVGLASPLHAGNPLTWDPGATGTATPRASSVTPVHPRTAYHSRTYGVPQYGGRKVARVAAALGRTLQLLTALFQRGRVGPYALKAWNIAVKRAVVRQDFVFRPPHSGDTSRIGDGPFASAQHRFPTSRRTPMVCLSVRSSQPSPMSAL